MCEIVYTAIVFDEYQHDSDSAWSARKAIINFMKKGKTFKYGLQEGGVFNEFIAGIRANNMVDPPTGHKFTEEDIKQIETDRDEIMKQVARVADPDERSDKTSTGFSDRAYKQIWRMCQAYEEYCIKTKQPWPLPMNIVKNLPPHIKK